MATEQKYAIYKHHSNHLKQYNILYKREALLLQILWSKCLTSIVQSIDHHSTQYYHYCHYDQYYQ